MLKKIVLAMNIEVDDVNNTIRNRVNNRIADDFVQYCMEDAYFLDIVTKNLIRYGYGDDISNAFKRGDYKYVLESMNSEEEYCKFFTEALEDMNRFIFLKFEADTYLHHDLTGTVVLPIAYSGNRPNTEHVYIGWVTPHNTNHLLQHEKLNIDSANLFQKSYSNFLRMHKDKFDVFFDGSSADEVISYMRSL